MCVGELLGLAQQLHRAHPRAADAPEVDPQPIRLRVDVHEAVPRVRVVHRVAQAHPPVVQRLLLRVDVEQRVDEAVVKLIRQRALKTRRRVHERAAKQFLLVRVRLVAQAVVDGDEPVCSLEHLRPLRLRDAAHHAGDQHADH